MTFAVAPGITLTITGRPGHWTIWTTDTDGELHFAGKSQREKAHVAATEVHDAIVDARIRAAGLQDMARADRVAAAELAARKETTQALWDALRVKVTPAPRTAARRRTRAAAGAGAASAAAAATAARARARRAPSR